MGDNKPVQKQESVDFEDVLRFAKAKWPRELDLNGRYGSWGESSDSWWTRLFETWWSIPGDPINTILRPAYEAHLKEKGPVVRDEVPGCPGATWQDVVEFAKGSEERKDKWRMTPGWIDGVRGVLPGEWCGEMPNGWWSQHVKPTFTMYWAGRSGVLAYDGSDDGKCACCGGDRTYDRITACRACWRDFSESASVPGPDRERRLALRAFGIKTGRWKGAGPTATIHPASTVAIQEKPEPWCCPVCLRSDRPKAKDTAVCERCKPAIAPKWTPGRERCEVERDYNDTEKLQKVEAAAMAESQIRWAMSLKRQFQSCSCGKNLVWNGKWKHLGGRKVLVNVGCSECKKDKDVTLEVKER